MSGKRTIGTCGRCGGPVTVPLVFHSIKPPTPSCDDCGARPKQAHGPVMDMEDGFHGPPPRPLPRVTY